MSVENERGDDQKIYKKINKRDNIKQRGANTEGE